MSGHPTRRRRWGVIAAIALAVAPACSVSTNDQPQAAGERFDEFVQSTTTSSTTTPENTTRTELVFFLDTGAGGQTRTQPVERPFEVDAPVESVIESLFDTPPDRSGEERPTEEGLTTAIPEAAVLGSAEMATDDPTELVIDSTLFDTVQGTPLRHALAQVVLTATSLPAVESVSFQQDGDANSPIIGSGETVDRAVTSDDYQRLG